MLCAHEKKRARARLCLLYVPSSLSCRPSQLRVLQLLLMLEVRLLQAWRGMVPITRGNDRDKFNPPGTSTYTCRHRRPTERVSKHFCLNRSRFDLFMSGKFSARGDRYFYIHMNDDRLEPRTSCQPLKTSGGNTSGTFPKHL